MNVVFSSFEPSGKSKVFNDFSAIRLSRLVLAILILARIGFGTTIGSAQTPGSAGKVPLRRNQLGRVPIFL